MLESRKEKKYVGKFLEHDYDKFTNDFLSLLKDYKRKTQRLDKIIKQSDKHQFQFLQLNEELEEYKQKLENRIETDKILFQKSREAQMGEMISMIAHQWRQPLASVSCTVAGMQLDQMNLNFENKDELEQFFKIQNQKFERINNQIKSLSNTIDDFRNFFKPNKEKEMVDITLPIVKALALVQVDMQNYNIEINVDFQVTQEISIHKNEIIQVILTILKNSEDSFRQNNILQPKIDIKTMYDEKSNPIILIKDNGGGIAEDILPNIFDPYFSTKDEKNGTGLGLYMSKMIIEEYNNGKIIINNDTDGCVVKLFF